MAASNHYVATITMNVNALNSPIKDIEWMYGLKNKIHQYAAKQTQFFTEDAENESEEM